MRYNTLIINPKENFCEALRITVSGRSSTGAKCADTSARITLPLTITPSS
ncbi:MAG: hypothetical protein IJU26_05140 [Synergistaceae bacterium]|nr:hypothetical protein [Synergistaceae bacterium]